MNSDTDALRGLWLAIILLTATLVAVLSAATFLLAGAEVDTALGAAGASFIGVTTLGISVRRFLAG
jgi:hypothetical protein